MLALTPALSPRERESAAEGLWLALPDLGDKASIGLLLGFGFETAFFDLRIQQHRAAVGSRAQLLARSQRAQCLENFYHRLRRLQAPRIHIHCRSWAVPGRVFDFFFLLSAFLVFLAPPFALS